MYPVPPFLVISVSGTPRINCFLSIAYRFGNQPELAVEALNDIRCIYDFPNPRWIFIKSAQNFPVVLLAFHAGGVLLPPLFAEPEQMSLRLVQGHGGVDFL